MILTESDFKNAPDDPEKKFAYLAEKCRSYLYSTAGMGSVTSIENSRKREFLAVVRALAEDLAIRQIPRASGKTVDAELLDMLAAIGTVVTRVRLGASSASGRHLVGLAATTRAEIERKIAKLRAYIENAEMPEAKRKALLRKLEELRKALDEKRVNMGMALIILSSVVLASTTFLAEVPDALKTATSIIAMIARDQELEDAERKRLEGPPDKLAITDQRDLS